MSTPDSQAVAAPANYSATCTDCEAKNVKSVYYGESGKSGIYRVQKGHKNDIKRRNKKML